MKGFESLLSGMDAFERVKGAVAGHATPVLATGLSAVHKAQLVVSITGLLQMGGLVIVPDEAAAVRICEDINIMAGAGTAVQYPSREPTFYDVQGVSHEYEHARLAVLGRLRAGDARIVAASAQAALQYTMPPSVLAARTRTIESGGQYDIKELIAFLVAAGYTRCDQVDGVCQFSQRGGILDFSPPHMPDPFRIEFWGDEIDTISTFKTDTQRRVDTVKRVDITPAAEVVADSPARLVKLLESAAKGLRGTQGKRAKEKLAQEIEQIENGVLPQSLDRWMPLLYPEPATLFDYMPKAALFLCDTANCRESLKTVQWQQNEDVKILLEEGVLFKGCDRFAEDFVDLQRHAAQSNTVLLDTFARSVGDIPLRDMVDIRAVQLSSWSGGIFPAARGRAGIYRARLPRGGVCRNRARGRLAGGGSDARRPARRAERRSDGFKARRRARGAGQYERRHGVPRYQACRHLAGKDRRAVGPAQAAAQRGQEAARHQRSDPGRLCCAHGPRHRRVRGDC